MIKLLTPEMPTADELLPYLRRIDQSHVYVSRGPLVQELEERLEDFVRAPVVTVGSGTQALSLTLQALGMLGQRVAMPAFTFSATGLAALNVGAFPVLHDVSPFDWHLRNGLDATRYGAVMPVAALGVPVAIDKWEHFRCPVVIDAAGAFPLQPVSQDRNIITCFSLHATKFIGCGEGGFVASHDMGLIERIRELSTFGECGTNGKMSEYHAAVALASLDRMVGKATRARRRLNWYDKYLPVFVDSYTGNDYSTLLVVELPVKAGPVMEHMKSKGIETKQWYRPFLDERPEFAQPRGNFPVTDHLREHLIGLPFHNFLTEDDVKFVCETLEEAVNG